MDGSSALLFKDLSFREIQILEMVRDDATNFQIAHDLGISEQTVKNHMSSIHRKFGVQSRTSAVIKAIRGGYISLHTGDAPHPDVPTMMEAIAATRDHIERELDELVQHVARMRAPQ